MCTITLEYNQSNALARRKLAALLATGLFLKKDFQPDDAYKPTKNAPFEKIPRNSSMICGDAFI